MSGLTKEQREQRMTGMGGSDVADLVEGNLVRIYRSKTEPDYQTEDSAAQLRGRVLEPAVRELYQLTTGAELLGGGFLRHPRNSIVIGTLDDCARRDEEERVVEIKTAGRHVLRDWGDGEDSVPPRYIVQCQWYAGLAGLPAVDLACLLGGDLQIYTLRADPELFGLLVEKAERFWRDHVEPKRPPPPDASPAYSEWLSERFPTHSEALAKASPEVERWVAEYRQASAEAAVATKRRDAAKNALKERIADASGVEGDGWRITWRACKGRESVDWAAVAAEAGVSKELILKHTARKPGYRVFRPSWKEQSDE